MFRLYLNVFRWSWIRLWSKKLIEGIFTQKLWECSEEGGSRKLAVVAADFKFSSANLLVIRYYLRVLEISRLVPNATIPGFDVTTLC